MGNAIVTLDATQFRAYLETLPEGTIIGMPSHKNTCPLCRYIQALGPVTPRGEPVRYVEFNGYDFFHVSNDPELTPRLQEVPAWAVHWQQEAVDQAQPDDGNEDPPAYGVMARAHDAITREQGLAILARVLLDDYTCESNDCRICQLESGYDDDDDY